MRNWGAFLATLIPCNLLECYASKMRKNIQKLLRKDNGIKDHLVLILVEDKNFQNRTIYH